MKLGALESIAADVETPSRMVVIDPESQRPLVAMEGEVAVECYIDLLSADSAAGRAVDRARSAAAFRKARSGRTGDQEDNADIQAELLTALAVGWYFGPDAEPFSKRAAQELFSNPSFSGIRKQAYVHVYSDVNFMKRSSTS